MSQCTVCGNDYDQSFVVVTATGQRYVFDSVECAAQLIAPTCAHCGCRVLGHGVESAEAIYCCAHCARGSSTTAARDRV